jgi:hypothetical protein
LTSSSCWIKPRRWLLLLLLLLLRMLLAQAIRCILCSSLQSGVWLVKSHLLLLTICPSLHATGW